MRKISAHYIINPGEKPIRNGILELDDDGTVINLRSTEQFHEEDKLEFYSGILVPGFVNVHCHLELSHLKNQITQKTGLSKFVEQVVNKRELILSQDSNLMQNQLFKMHQTGTQALGDIANTKHSLKAKIKSPVQVHTFVELFGLNPENSAQIWDNGIQLVKEFRQAGLSASPTPHAPYSVSTLLWEKFADHAEELKPTISLHNQESQEEHNFIRHHSGPLKNRFLSMKIPAKHFPGPAESSTRWYNNLLPDIPKLLLIHNTYTSIEDIRFLSHNNPGKEIYYGLCPNANMFIENTLPDEILKNRKDLNLCIGTDSLASNFQLSVWEEIKTIAKAYPNIPLEEFITMASLNGAKALGLDKQIGSFEQGKKPGVVLLEGINPANSEILENSQSRRIV